MPERCYRPTLILEGPGERAAVPSLIRSICYHHEIYDFHSAPNPIIHQNIPKLDRLGELERFVGYATRHECDCVLVVLDTDGNCACKIFRSWVERISAMHVNKRIGVAFFNAEFESLFLHCLDKIAAAYPDYGWQLGGWEVGQAHEEVVGAKAALSRRMRRGRSYKEVRDQVRFIDALDFARLRDLSRSFRHFEDMLLWLNGFSEASIFPASRPL